MKRFLTLLLMLSVLIGAFSGVAVANERGVRLVDNANLLTKGEAEVILKALDEISEKYQYDIVILTEKSIGNKSEIAFADDYYDYNGYGYGEDYTGLLLLITFDELGGIWYISTCGEAINAFSDDVIQSIGDTMKTDLKDGNYASAFETFISECDYYIEDYITFDFGSNIIISLIIGFVIAFIAVSVMKSKLNSVAFQRDAKNYVKQGSMNLTVERDLYLYSTVTRTAKPKENSSTHTSSSGRSHGGGGGRF